MQIYFIFSLFLIVLAGADKWHLLAILKCNLSTMEDKI